MLPFGLAGQKGVLQDWDILFVDGKVDKIAPDISVPLGSALTIDGTGKHVTPGLIDCHSHSAASSINEGSQSVTAEVRIKDVLYSDDINIYRQLGGGLYYCQYFAWFCKSNWRTECGHQASLGISRRSYF